MEKLIEEILTGIFTHLNINPEIKIEENENVYNVTIEGDDLNYLIGYHGYSLDALQNIVGLALFRKTEKPTTVVIDINGYREKKAEKLAELTRTYIDKVRFFEKEIQMPFMNPWERRQVHMFVSEYTDVESESTGEGRDRRVVLKPKI